MRSSGVKGHRIAPFHAAERWERLVLLFVWRHSPGLPAGGGIGSVPWKAPGLGWEALPQYRLLLPLKRQLQSALNDNEGLWRVIELDYAHSGAHTTLQSVKQIYRRRELSRCRGVAKQILPAYFACSFYNKLRLKPFSLQFVSTKSICAGATGGGSWKGWKIYIL